MKGKTLWWAAAIAAVLALGAGGSALAQAPLPEHLHGIINDYTSSHDIKGNLTGPWEMRGTWSMEVHNRSGLADFSAAMTMEHSDYAITQDVVNADDPMTRAPHTHHFTMKGATISYNTSACPPKPTGKPPTTGRFVINGNAEITGNGSPASFSKNQTVLSPLQVCITGGTEVEFSNITLMLGAPATGHFGTQPIHGLVRRAKDPDHDDHDDH